MADEDGTDKFAPLGDWLEGGDPATCREVVELLEWADDIINTDRGFECEDAWNDRLDALLQRLRGEP